MRGSDSIAADILDTLEPLGHRTHPADVEVAARRRAHAFRPGSAPSRSAITLNAVPQPRPKMPAYVSAVFSTIGEALAGNETDTIAGGRESFTTRTRAGQGRNPRTGESIAIAASKTPAFKAGRILRETVSDGDVSYTATTSTAETGDLTLNSARVAGSRETLGDRRARRFARLERTPFSACSLQSARPAGCDDLGPAHISVTARICGEHRTSRCQIAGHSSQKGDAAILSIRPTYEVSRTA